MVSLLKNYRAKKKEAPYVGLIHRLDQPVEGVMVFAKDQKAAAALSKQVADRGVDKYYLAVVLGALDSNHGNLKHWLIKDGKTNLSRVAAEGDPTAKEAKLSYWVLDYDKKQNLSLVKIKLDTGRHHQIRVQFSAIGHPLLGDQKYNAGAAITDPGLENGIGGINGGNVALCSYKIGFEHPKTGKKMEYEILPQNPYFTGFDVSQRLDN